MSGLPPPPPPPPSDPSAPAADRRRRRRHRRPRSSVPYLMCNTATYCSSVLIHPPHRQARSPSPPSPNRSLFPPRANYLVRDSPNGEIALHPRMYLSRVGRGIRKQKQLASSSFLPPLPRLIRGEKRRDGGKPRTVVVLYFCAYRRAFHSTYRHGPDDNRPRPLRRRRRHPTAETGE